MNGESKLILTAVENVIDNYWNKFTGRKRSFEELLLEWEDQKFLASQLILVQFIQMQNGC